MAKKTNTMGLITTVQLHNDTGALAGTAVNLCGHDSITWEVGTPDEVDITTFCDLDKVNESGMSNEGTLDINFKLLDEKDVGQKLIEDAPLNARIQIVLDFTNGKKITFKTRKKQETSGSVTLADIVVNGSVQLGLIGKPVKTSTP
jgi:hypothetical protein